MVKIPKDEAGILAGFMRELKTLDDYIAIRIEDSIRSGTPDLALARHHVTRWLEFKHGTPNFESSGLQNLVCRRLDRYAWCRYVIWWEDGRERKTLVVRPTAVRDHLAGGPLIAEAECAGFNHRWLVDYIRNL